MWWWRNRREIESLKDRLDALEWGSGLLREGGGLEALREEIRTQGEAQRDQTAQLVEVLKPKPPQAPTLKSLLVSNWLVGLRGLPGWGFRFVTDHWQWCLGVAGAAIALGVPAYLQFEANQLQKEANAFSRDTLKALSVQIERQDAQIKKQDADTRIVRRAQLLNTIYGVEDCDVTEDLAAWEEQQKQAEERQVGFYERKPRCDPKAFLRLRRDAVLALSRIDGQDLDLSDADLSKAKLSNTIFRNAYLRFANLSEADLSEADLSEANLTGANLMGANLTGANLMGAKLTGANLMGAKLLNADLGKNANLMGANLRTAHLMRLSLIDANLRNANLSGALLWSANLDDASLNGAKLIGAILMGAKLRGADLSDADLSGAKALTQKQLNVTCGDSKTQIPEYLDERPEHWLDRPAEAVDYMQRNGCP